MSTFLSWKAHAIFLSSTFRDMHADRDILRAETFPVLEEKLRDRAHYLETIDLRQGVETSELGEEGARELKVLKVCLEEIARSRPFFVAVLGDRYGWVPPEAHMHAAARGAGIRLSLGGRSVTELEILHGVLESDDQHVRSWFYLRETDYTGMPLEARRRCDERAIIDDPASSQEERDLATERWAKLEALKKRIRSRLPGRWKSYHVRWDAPEAGLGKLAKMVEADIWSDLEVETREYLRDQPKTWREAEKRGLEDFVVERTRGYVGRMAITRPMLDHALSSADAGAPWAQLVTGDAGTGKSSLFGRVYRKLVKHPGVLLLGNAAGISVDASQIDRVLQRWIGELAAHLGVEDPLQEKPSAKPENDLPGNVRTTLSARIDSAFSALLSQAAERTRVVVLLDALDQQGQGHRAQDLAWLPRIWPANARLIATAIPGPASAALLERPGAVELPLPAITRAEAARIARRFFRGRYHRDVNERALQGLLTKTLPTSTRPVHGNALWLALALQEMNLLEADDFERAELEFPNMPGAERMEALLVSEVEALPSDPVGIFGELIARAGRGYGVARTEAVLGVIALGRVGWRESDLRKLVPAVSEEPWSDLAFAGIRRTLGGHLVQRGSHAEWDAFHVRLRESILARDLAGAGRETVHDHIVQHLLSIAEDDPLRTSETMFHILRGSEVALQSVLYLGSGSPVAISAAAPVVVDHWLEEGPTAAAGRIERFLGWFEERRIGPGLKSRALLGLTDALTELGTRLPLQEGLLIARARLIALESLPPPPIDPDYFFTPSAQPEIIERGLQEFHMLLDRGDLERATGNQDNAKECYTGMLSIMEVQHPDLPGRAGLEALCLERLGDVELEAGRPEEAQRLFEQMLALREGQDPAGEEDRE